MIILEKINSFIKKIYSIVKKFFTQENSLNKTSLEKVDLVDILISLLPAAIFGCLLFGWRAVLTILICVAASLLTDFLWNLIFKTNAKKLNFQVLVTSLVLSLSLSSMLNPIFTVLVAVCSVVLQKKFFSVKPMDIISPILISKALFLIVFFKFFNIYAFPFVSEVTKTIPFDYLSGMYSYVFPAKYLFFGLHSGNIGETSVLMLLIGGIYLMLRKLINPVISITYILTTAILSFVFKQPVAISLMGTSLFFVAFFMTMDYGFKTTALYKKILYGISCGVLTFVLRFVFKTELAFLAVLLSNFIFAIITRQNIKSVINYIKQIDFKKLISKTHEMFGYILGFLRKIIFKEKKKNGEEIEN